MFLAKGECGFLAMILLVSGLVFLACDAGDDEYEGDEAGECSDSTDNDGDGLADCDDEGCQGSPLCREADGDADSDGDTDADADGTPDGYKRVGEIFLTERVELGATQSRGWARFEYVPDRVELNCGQVTETFGHCTLTRGVEPTCPPCGADEVCDWDEWCNSRCRPLNPEPPTCDPPCQTDQVCWWNEDHTAGECMDIPPLPLRAGTISVTGGSTQATVTCTPSEPGEYTASWDIVTESDWWAAGDTLYIEAPGDTFPAFSMDLPAPGVPELTTDTSAWTLATFDGSAPVDVTWIPASGDFRIGIEVGDSRGLRCVTDDDGSFTISTEALEAMDWEGSELNIMIMRMSSTVVNDGEDGEVTGSVGTWTNVQVQ
jgi:hypothetical protein